MTKCNAPQPQDAACTVDKRVWSGPKGGCHPNFGAPSGAGGRRNPGMRVASGTFTSNSYSPRPSTHLKNHRSLGGPRMPNAASPPSLPVSNKSDRRFATFGIEGMAPVGPPTAETALRLVSVTLVFVRHRMECSEVVVAFTPRGAK